jgi:membrane-associated phospholipid phosphatase
MSIMNWSFITDFGDSAVTGPIALAIAAWLVASHAWRGAASWFLLFGAGAFSVFCTKVAYAGWDIGVPAITGVSGHSFASTSVFAVTGYFLGSNFPKPAKYFGGCLGYFAGVIVGLTRVILGDHSPSEVVIGCMLGGVIAVAAIEIIRPRLRIVAAPLVFAFMVVILMFTLHGQKAPSEPLAIRVALFLSGRSTPFVRGAH